MKLVFFTPRVRPVIEGIGDYTWNLVEALRRAGIDAHLVTSHDQSSGPAWLHPMIKEWKKEEMASAAQSFRPDWISIQYSPPLYGRYGICPAIAAAPAFLRDQCGCRVSVTFHEFTIDKVRSLRSFFLKWISDSQTSAIMKTCDAAVTTCARYAELLDGMNTAFKTAVIPVGASSLPGEISHDEMQSLRRRLGLEAAKVFVVFGRLSHFRNYAVSLRALASAREKGIPAFLILLGNMRSSNPALYEELSASATKAGIEKYLIETGDLAAGAVSAYLQISDVFLFPQSDGISTRNTTVMSAFAHGLPIAAFEPVPGNFNGYEVPYGSLVQRDNEEEFVRGAVRLLEESRGSEQKKTMNKRYFADHFSWDKIAEKYTAALVRYEN